MICHREIQSFPVWNSYLKYIPWLLPSGAPTLHKNLPGCCSHSFPTPSCTIPAVPALLTPVGGNSWSLPGLKELQDAPAPQSCWVSSQGSPVCGKTGQKAGWEWQRGAHPWMSPPRRDFPLELQHSASPQLIRAGFIPALPKLLLFQRMCCFLLVLRSPPPSCSRAGNCRALPSADPEIQPGIRRENLPALNKLFPIDFFHQGVAQQYFISFIIFFFYCCEAQRRL